MWRPESWRGGVVAVVQAEAAAGLTLALAVTAAIVWANIPWRASYEAVWNHPVGWFPLPSGVPHNMQSVINEGLMTIFFLGVGLEIGRERALGSLQDLRNAVLPVASALAGMAGAALVYLIVVTAGGAGHLVRSGWGIPMATDVAFALGALALLGRRVPRELRIFVLALAVTDDVASVMVLAIVASQRLDVWPILGALAVLGLVACLRSLYDRTSPEQAPATRAARLARRLLDRTPAAGWPYAAAGVAEWLLLSRGGVEPALAGVAVGILVPCGAPSPRRARLPRTGASPSARLEHLVLPLSTFVVLPLFAMANTGIRLESALWSAPSSRTVLVGVAAARVIGKLAGIGAACALLVRFGVTRLPPAVHWTELAGVALLCGIGFTVPLLFADAAFASSPDLIAAADAGLLASSIAALVLGSIWLLAAHRRLRR